MPRVFEMDANLVGSACEREAAEQGATGKHLAHLEPGDGGFAVFGINPHDAGSHRMGGELGVDFELFFQRNTVDQGGVCFSRAFGWEKL